MRSRPFLIWFLLALLWGSEWILTASLPAQPPLLSLSLRYAVASLVLLPWAVRGRLWQQPPRRLLQLGMIGAGLLAVPQILSGISARGISPAWSLLAFAGVPVLLAAAGYGAISTAVCGFAGVVFLLASNLTIHASQLPWLVLPVGAAILVSITLAHAAAALQQQIGGGSLSSALFVQCAVAAALTGVAASAVERQPLVWSIAQIAGVLATALIATVAAYFLFFRLLSRIGPERLGMLQWAQLLVAVAESAVVTRARPGWESLAGVLLIGIALRRAWAVPEDEQGVMLQITGR